MSNKEVRAKIRLQISGGGATPAVGVALGQYKVSIMEFCKQFNAKTADKKGQTVPTVITVYKDGSFDFVIKSPPTSELIKKKLNIPKGSSRPHEDFVGQISMSDVEEIAKVKMTDLNANDLDQAKKIIAGSARSMGIRVID